MSEASVQTPVALIIFNRPDLTAKVFGEIAKAKPRQLLIVADGPRANWPGDAEKCAAARQEVERIDWECEVRKNYSDTNLGCGRRPATGITWVFEQVDRAIILEDDCVPHPTFFRFCDEVLEKYRDDERIMHIAGNNCQYGRGKGEYSYYFSRHNICHGWATWARAWRHFDIGLRLWPSLRPTRWLLDTAQNVRAAAHWADVFERAYIRDGDVDYWDYQWTFACWSQNGLSILPNTTLITNIGFGKHATHTTWSGDPRANVRASKMIFPLRHPPYVVRDEEADQFFINKAVLPQLPKPVTLYETCRRKVVSTIPRSVRKHLRTYLPASN